jgi:hypothetical protein
VEPDRLVAWSGKTIGISAVHVYRFEPAGSGTKVITEESFQGPLVRLLKGSLQRTLDKTLVNGLRLLKQAVEKSPSQP